MTETLTLTDFLLVRVAADEAVAHEVRVDDYSYDVAADRRFEAYGDHVEAGVARVLAECAAKRVIVAEHEMTVDAAGGRCCLTCADDSPHGLVGPWPCPTLRALASVYVGQDGWREEWA